MEPRADLDNFKEMDFLQLMLVFGVCLLQIVDANSPPEFVLDDNARGGDIVVKLREGADTPPGTVIYR